MTYGEFESPLELLKKTLGGIEETKGGLKSIMKDRMAEKQNLGIQNPDTRSAIRRIKTKIKKLDERIAEYNQAIETLTCNGF